MLWLVITLCGHVYAVVDGHAVGHVYAVVGGQAVGACLCCARRMSQGCLCKHMTAAALDTDATSPVAHTPMQIALLRLKLEEYTSDANC